MAERKHGILVIDDDPIVPMALGPYFSGVGYDLRTAHTAADGLNDVLANPPSVILLAVSLPDSSGLEVFRQLRSRSRTRHIPVMFLASYGEDHTRNAVLAAGADDFVAKPFDADLLGLRIRNAVKRSERDGLNHPRSGLPTGQLIQERVRALADEYGWYKIDLGIENFDAFVERYGFMIGEEVIVFTAKLLNDVVQTAGTPDDFIGQRDDTNFTIITRARNGPTLQTLLAQRFDAEVRAFYNFDERERGYLEVDGSAAGSIHKPLMMARLKFQEGEAE